MSMIKTNRCIALVLVLALLCGMTVTACADVVTLGIYFCGRRTAEDGSEVIVKLQGKFRVMQNYRDDGHAFMKVKSELFRWRRQSIRNGIRIPQRQMLYRKPAVR